MTDCGSDGQYRDPGTDRLRRRVILALLHASRDRSALQLTSHTETETGRALAEWFTMFLDVVRSVAVDLPAPQRTVIDRLYLVERTDMQQAQYGYEQAARDLHVSVREIARLRRAALDAIGVRLWPLGLRDLSDGD